MTNKDNISPSMMVMPQGWQPVPQDEIDLRELMLVLWGKKGLITIITLIFASIGILYAMLAPQVWTSQAQVTASSIEQTRELRLKIEQLLNNANDVDVSSLQQESLYKDFIAAFNAMNTKRSFLTQQGIFAEEAKLANVSDERGQRALMQRLAEKINAKPVDKVSQDMILSFSAQTPEVAKQRLEKYIDFVQSQQKIKKNSELLTIWDNRIQTLKQQYESVYKDTQLARQDAIRRTQYSLRISQAAGADKPIENLNSEDLFNIQLGSKGLSEKLQILQEIKNPEVLNPALGQIRLKLGSLEALDMKNIDFTSYQMSDSPDMPISRDKPKRPLVVVLATLLGGMLGVGIVLLRHAFRQKSEA